MSGEYVPSTWDWVAEQVDAFEASDGREANTLMDTGIPIVVMTMTGHRTGAIRKVPVMRVERDGEYCIVASKGGMPTHPGWYYNLLADPEIVIQDGSDKKQYVVREVSGDERDEWFDLAASVYPPYLDYEKSATGFDRVIPVLVATPRS